jgi:hypothetical protein
MNAADRSERTHGASDPKPPAPEPRASGEGVRFGTSCARPPEGLHPDLGDKAIDRYGLVGANEQMRHHETLLGATQSVFPPSLEHPHMSKAANLK